MYSYFFHEKSTPIFLPGKEPVLTRLSHSYDNPTWSANYHVHKNEIELAYIDSGMATYALDRDEYTVRKGDLLIIEPGVLHGLASDREHPASVWSIGLTGFQLQQQPEPLQILPPRAIPIIKAGQEEPIIYTIVNEIHRQHQLGTPMGLYLCNQLAGVLLGIYCQRFADCEVRDVVPSTSFVREIMIYINFHYNEKITLKSLATMFHRSENYISHEFKSIYGVSPINYAIERRMCEAKWLLINTVDTMQTIARTIGYDNVNYFINLFTKRLGMAPTAYREAYGMRPNV